jgi:hypothetical protein
LDLFANAYTDAEVVARYKTLTPAMQLKYRSVLEPRAREEVAGPTIFCLTVDGLGARGGKQYCPRCGWTSDDGFGDCFKTKEGGPENE